MQLTLSEAAAVLGKSERQVRYLISQGKLGASKSAGRWVIDSGKLKARLRHPDAEVRSADGVFDYLGYRISPKGIRPTREHSGGVPDAAARFLPYESVFRWTRFRRTPHQRVQVASQSGDAAPHSRARSRGQPRGLLCRSRPRSSLSGQAQSTKIAVICR